MVREIHLPAGAEHLSVMDAAVYIATNLHPFTPYSELPEDVIARIRYQAALKVMQSKLVRMIKSQQLRTIDRLTLLTKEYQPSGLLLELDFTREQLEEMTISLPQFLDICESEHLNVFVDPNYHLIPSEPQPELIEPKPETESEADQQTEPESVKDEGLSIYEQRKESFNQWRVDSGADIVSLTAGATLEILKSRNKNLWNLTLGSYRSEFWHPYGRECGIRKRQGRPAKR